MSSSPADSYLETQVLTATPQRLRLMLIEEGLRRVRAADEAWAAGDKIGGTTAVGRAREVISELIGGIKPDDTKTAKQVLGIYLYLFSTLTEAGLSTDRNRLAHIVRVLEEERVTWQQVCESLPDRPSATQPLPAEELAPAVVASQWSPSYSADGNPSAVSSTASFSIDA